MATITRTVGGVTATLTGGGLDIVVRGRPDAGTLASLGRALFVARVRAALDRAELGKEPAAMGWRAEAYVAGRAAIVASGRSQNRSVAIETTGMRRWNVHVAADADADAVREAGERLIEDHARQIRALKRTIWQPEGTGNARRPAESWWDNPPDNPRQGGTP
jgi:hypothetical protein